MAVTASVLGMGIRQVVHRLPDDARHVAGRAGVRTINDKTLTWRDPHRRPTLAAPRLDTGAKVAPCEQCSTPPDGSTGHD